MSLKQKIAQVIVLSCLISASFIPSAFSATAPQETIQKSESQTLLAQRRGSQAYVCTRDRNGYVRLRAYPSLRSRVIGRINNRQYLTILRSRNNWYRVNYRGRTGWVSRDFVCRGNQSRYPSRRDAYVCTRDRNGYVRLRAYPSLRSRIIGRVNNGQYLNILRSRGNWHNVRYRGQIGWVSRDFVCRGNSPRTSQSNSRNKIRLTMYINMYDGVYRTKTVYVSATRPVTDIVGKVLKEKYILPSGVRLIDYKVTVRNRIARIYFIVDPNARSIGSAASSEIDKLESLNATLTRNSQLNINKVVLFENGDRITPEVFDF